ncbi:glycosyltransferase [Demequina sp. NBRC 110056]|uniref:glycosyltransferase n=1 Tax=Demequina sp. NBRC 110056 TaxID=1570345 RepID=UPI00352B9399
MLSPGALTITADATVVPHPSYREWYGLRSAPDLPLERRNNVVHFGLLRPYKNIEELLDAWAGMPKSKGMSTLSIVGDASPAYAAHLSVLVNRIDGAKLVPRRASDDELVSLISQSLLAVFPRRNTTNSGAVLLALSVGTPVLIEGNAHGQSLEKEFGSQWVKLFDAPLDATALEASLVSVQSEGRAGWPDMSNRTWARTVDAHVDLYQRYAPA